MTQVIRLWIATNTFLILTVLSLGQVALAQGGGRAQEKKAASHYTSGAERFERGDYLGAIVEFKAANSILPAPELDYNVAASYEKLGDTKRALEYYKSYLQKVPEAGNRQEVKDKMVLLEARRAKTLAKQTKPQTITSKQTATVVAPQAQLPELQAQSEMDLMAGRHRSKLPEERIGQYASEEVTAGGGASSSAPWTEGDVAKPVYEKWWFWVAVGGAAIVTLAIIDNNSSSSDTPVLNSRSVGNGLGVLRF